MSARDELFESMTPHDRRPAPGEAESVNAMLDEYRDDVRRDILGTTLNPSTLVLDAEAYRILRPAIEATMAEPDRWDGDEAEVAILARYVEWLAGERQQHRAEVLAEAAGFVRTVAAQLGFPLDITNMLCEELDGAEAGKDTGGQPAGESTQPTPAQVWHVFDEDTGQPLPPLFTTRAAAEQGTIDRYQAAGEYSPDYSWRPAEDGARELLAGGDPVGIYLTPVTINGDTAAAPDFFQPGRTYTRQHHGDTIEFYVDHLSTAPGSTNPTAFGWRRNPGGEWEPTDSDDMDGWTATGAAATETCGQCRRPFDEADTRWDGRSRYGDTPFCRACVDRCHDTEIADHRCLICAKGGDAR